MKINDIKLFIKACASKNVAVPTLLIGTMGVGKSQIMKQVTEELEGFRLIDLRLAQMEVGDLIGVPYQLNGKTVWAEPSWWPSEDEKCIILLDELNRAPTDVRQGAFQLVLDRRLHTHALPKNCYVHAAVNPDNGNYQVETLDPAMMRRFCAIEVTPDVDQWLAWGKGAGKIDSTLTEFINTNRGLLYQQEEIKFDVKPTPDSYRMLNTLMAAGVIAKENQMEIFRGLIGKEASIALIKWLDKNYNRPVSGEQILNEYSAVAAKVKKQNTAENYDTSNDLVAILTNKTSLTPVELANASQYILDIPKESQMALIAKLPKDGRKLLLKDQRVSVLLLSLIAQP